MKFAAYIALRFPLLGAGLIFFLEGFGIPIPVEVPLGIIGWRLHQGLNDYWDMVMLMFLASVLGNVVGYGLGYYGGRPLALALTRRLGVKTESWERIESWFQRHGLLLTVGTRWINWGFAQNMMLAGITRVPFGKFLAILVVNDFFWAMGWVWIAMKAMARLRRGLDLINDYQADLAWTAVAIMAVGLLGWLLWRRFRARRKP